MNENDGDGRAGRPDASIDHVAIEVADLDARVAWYTDHLALEVRRWGRLTSDPDRRVVMLADPRGVKLELVERRIDDPETDDRLLHLAWHVDDVDGVERALVDDGATSVRPPARLEAARSRTATVQPPAGAPVQLVRYDPDSPDR